MRRGRRGGTAPFGVFSGVKRRKGEAHLGPGSVEIGSEARPVEAGSAVFIPGDVFHSLANTGALDLRFAYVFPADSFGEVEYVFDE